MTFANHATHPLVDDEFQHELLSLINDELSLDPDTVVDHDTDLVMTGQVDSLGVMDIVSWIEERLHTSIDSSKIVRENFESVDKMIQFARSLVQPS